jgi:hypothetical protein
MGNGFSAGADCIDGRSGVGEAERIGRSGKGSCGFAESGLGAADTAPTAPAAGTCATSESKAVKTPGSARQLKYLERPPSRDRMPLMKGSGPRGEVRVG